MSKIGALTLILLPCALTQWLSSSFGGNFYLDTAVGTATIVKASPTFGADAASLMKLGLHGSAAFAYNFSKSYQPIQFHLGLQHRISIGSQTESPGGYTFQIPYAILRIESLKKYLTLGVGKWAYLTPGGGFSPLNKVIPHYAFVIEMGSVWPITPEVAVLGALGAQVVHSTSGWGPMPIADALVALRFYYGAVHNFNKQRRYYWDDEDPASYPGYRYPYGYPR